MSATRLQFREYEPQSVDRKVREEIIEAADALRVELTPSHPQLSIGNGTVTLHNVVGSLRLPGGTILEIAPKVRTESDWTTSVVHLLDRTTRIAVSGSRRSESSSRPSDLTTALAIEYARRLDSAIRLDGPLTLYVQEKMRSARLNGRLNVGSWLRSAAIDPSKFPLTRNAFSSDNDFTRGLSIVAGLLSRAATGAQLRSHLRRLQAGVLPGHAIPTYVNPSVVHRQLPAQWRQYGPAWDIASALLKNRSVLGDPGRSAGLEVAVEPWPLLETLLERVLATLANDQENPLRFVPKTRYPILRQDGKTAARVEPDGVLADASGRIVATFEAKYTLPAKHPDRSHTYQALSTAAALDSPSAVIVYPGDEEPQHYDVLGFHGRPIRLITMGLSMFTYRQGLGDADRARRVSDALHNALTSSAA